LIAATNAVLDDYSEDFARQTQELQKTSAARGATDPHTQARAQVQLRFSATSVEAIVRYPVQQQRAAEIDERVSRELLNVIRSPAPPALSGPTS
jgi:hypothetical protein